MGIKKIIAIEDRLSRKSVYTFSAAEFFSKSYRASGKRVLPPRFNLSTRYKVAAREAVVNFTWRIRTRSLELGARGNRLNTILRTADVLNNVLGTISAVADGNPARIIGSVVGGTVGFILLYSDQGVEPPVGKTILEKWKSAVSSPNRRTMYFGMAVNVPMMVIGHASRLYYGIFADRPEQLWQLTVGLLGDSSGLRALYKRAVEAETEARNEKRTVDHQKDASKENTNPLVKQGVRFMMVAIDRLVLNRHTGFFIGLSITGLQLFEGWHVACHNFNDGKWMVLYNAISLALLGGNKAWQEMQWDKSYQRDFFWIRSVKQVNVLSRQGYACLHALRVGMQEVVMRNTGSPITSSTNTLTQPTEFLSNTRHTQRRQPSRFNLR